MKGYLKYILKNKKWGDSIFLGLVASMWGYRITVLRADNGREMRYRHDMPLGGTDIGLLFNGKIESGHYSGLWRMDGEFMSSKAVKVSKGFDEKVDKMEIELMTEDGEGKTGLDQNEMVVKKERFEELLKKEKMFDEMCKVIEAGGQCLREGGGVGQYLVLPKREKVKGIL